jgi:hypothetical protein
MHDLAGQQQHSPRMAHAIAGCDSQSDSVTSEGLGPQIRHAMRPFCLLLVSG